MTDNDSQDSTDDTYCLVNVDPKMKATNQYENIMQEIIKESQNDGNKTPTIDDSEITTDNIESRNGYYVCCDVKYVGCCTIKSTNDPNELNQCINDLSRQNNKILTAVKLFIPFFNNEAVKMLDLSTEQLILEFPICKIGFCTSGIKNYYDKYFTFSFLNSVTAPETTINILQCHVFQLKSIFNTERLLECFKQSFDTNPVNSLKSIKSFTRTLNVQFKLTLDIKEDDGKGNYQSVPKEDTQVFKLRSNVAKKVFVKLEPIQGPFSLKVERCVGLFIGAGRYLSDIDMNLLEMESLGELNSKTNGFSVSGDWDPNSKCFELLNNMREKEKTLFMTIGINFCLNELLSPLCLKIACKAKIFPENHRFWMSLKKSTILHLMLSLEELIDDSTNSIIIDNYVTKTIQYIWPDNVVTVNCQSNRELSTCDSYDSELEEPVKSGSGTVSKEIPADDQLIGKWATILNEWQSDINVRPKGLSQLIQCCGGVPEALRGEVWQLLAATVTKESQLSDVYRILISKDSKFDAVIRRDMPRTFTAHPMFTEKDGPGQEILFRVCKAFASYDEEIGYCQGSAFLAASLIIHMPEEQAFSVLVAIMNKYKIREMYMNNFQGLHICLYQLDNLMAVQHNDLYLHFSEMQLESHMYANQWFMTLFTMKFHLYAVFHILDLFLHDGIVIIFKVALALLKLSKKELLMMDFEGVLNYFRITLPKLYRNEEACKELIKVALSIKLSDKKLNQLEKEWHKIQEVRAETEDPIETLQKQLKNTKDEFNRLDQENDNLAKELISSKISMQKTIDKLEFENMTLEESLDTVNKELFITRNDLLEVQEQNHRLQEEVKQVKDRFREEMDDRQRKMLQQETIISQYKTIVKQLNQRMDQMDKQHQLRNQSTDADDEFDLSLDVNDVNDSSTAEANIDNFAEGDNQCKSSITSASSSKQLRELMLSVAYLTELTSQCNICSEKLHAVNTLPTLDPTTTTTQAAGAVTIETEDTSTNPDQQNEASLLCISRAQLKKYKQRICETELTLANTKLSLVESNCQQQKLAHELSRVQSSLEDKQHQLDDLLLSTNRNSLVGGASIMRKFLSKTITGGSPPPPSTTTGSSPSARLYEQEMSHSFHGNSIG